MSISNFPSNGAEVPAEIKQPTRISNPRKLFSEPTPRDVPDAPQTVSTSPFPPAAGRPHATGTASSAPTAQSVPHRAWEEGYRSPFAQISHSSIQPPPVHTSSFLATSLSVDPPTIRYPEGTTHGRGSYQRRARKVITKEITLNDVDASAMVDLGLYPFMVGQDMTANQNRFVRNECILARQFLRLQRDIYAHLRHHEGSLDKHIDRSVSTSTSGSHNMVAHSAGADPAFAALEKAYQNTRARLEALSQQVAEYSQSTERALADLAQQITHTGSHGVRRSPPTTTPFSPLLFSTSTSNLKRKRDSSSNSIFESPSTLPPPTPEFDNYRLPRTQ